MVEHRDRLVRFGSAMLEAALLASSRGIAVFNKGDVTDNLVRDMLEVLASSCARLSGRRSARTRAKQALRVIQGDVHG